jgi:colanic acid/amylovoran biosynthesis glycosyltransferase
LLIDPASGGAAATKRQSVPSAANEPTVLVIPTLSAHRAPSGRLVLTHKYITGLEGFCAAWPGKVMSAMRVTGPHSEGHLDEIEFQPEGAAFEVHGLASDLSGAEPYLRAASVVLLTDGREIQPLARLCQRMGVPYVLTLEWDWQTRRQNVWQAAPDVLRAAKRVLWAEANNLARVRTIRGAAGLQCNGTPAFEAYRRLNARTLLFFDSRVTREMIISESALDTRLASLATGGPLRLVFSGRLVTIKGADQLPRFAAALAHLGVPFTLDICGAGVLEGAIRADIQRLGLTDRVRLRGTLDYERELMPFVAGETDLFVCCHTQGDPSCTYLETMACGVPVAGYANSALRGMVERSGAGWATPEGDPERLAAAVARLAANRGEIAARSRAARGFSLEHTFEKTMRCRGEHLLACSRPAGSSS